MAVKTDAQCFQLILEKVGKVRGGQTASAEATGRVEKVFDSRIEFLRQKEVCWWDDDAIPMEVFDLLADYMAYYCPVITKAERNAYKMDSDIAFREMIDLAAMQSDDSPIEADYF